VKQQLLDNEEAGTEKQEDRPKKKATFELDLDLHTRLKMYTAG
jgi:hypothetical protein